jgi:hypothetical protein
MNSVQTRVAQNPLMLFGIKRLCCLEWYKLDDPSMHRITSDIDLSPLIGLEVTQVGVGRFEMILSLHPEGSITIEGEWTLRETSGAVVDRKMEHSQRGVWRLPVLLGKKILRCTVKNETHLEIEFNGFVLDLEDSSKQYESFSINHPALKLYV